ncbi:MAG: multidrug efflux pump subunit AcrB [Flammeovirgaceae bacterium]|jgi:multidrug efflux pump subunit AcrB
MLSPFRTVIIFIACSLVGLAVLPKLSVDLNPQERGNSLTINYQIPNSSPDVVEQLATAPIENALSQISGIKKIESNSGQGAGSVSLEFGREADMAFKRFEASTLLRQLRSKLPENMPYPTIRQAGKEDKVRQPMLIYSIRAPFAPFQIREVAKEKLATPISQLAGVGEVKVEGTQDLQISIDFQPELLQIYGISTNQILAEINSKKQAWQLGLAKEGAQQFFISIPKALGSLAELENLPIKLRDSEGALLSRPILLKEVAKVYLAEQTARSFHRVNGANAIQLYVYAEEGVNKLQVAKSTQQKMQLLERKMPESYAITLDYDDTKFIAEELDKIYSRTAFSIAILVLFILLIHRDWRYLAVLFAGLLVNLSLTFLLVWIWEINVHLYSLAGLTVSFGLILDNAIVMLDHLHKKGNQSVFKALLAASLTTIVALLLIFLLPYEERMNLTEFGQIVAINLGVSLLVALLFTPALYELIFKRTLYLETGVSEEDFEDSGKKQSGWFGFKPGDLKQKVNLVGFGIYEKLLLFLLRFRKSFYVGLTLLFGLPIFLLPSEVENWDWYNTTIGNKTYQKDYRIYVDKALGGSLRMFVRNVFEKSGYRSPEKTMLFVGAEMQSGSTLKQMDFIIKKVEEYLVGVEGIEQFVTQIQSPQYAKISISFLPEYEKGALPYRLKSQLTSKAVDWSGLEWSIYGVGKGFNNSLNDQLPSFRVEMRGFNYTELETQAGILAQKLLSHKRIQKVDINERLNYYDKSSQQFKLSLNRNTMNLVGINNSELMQFLRNRSVNYNPQSYFTIADKEYPIFLQSAKANEFSTYQLMQTAHKIGEETTRLNQFGTLELERTANSIQKEDRQYIRVIGFDYFGSPHFGNKYLKTVLEEIKPQLPIGYSAKKLDFSWDFDKTKRQYSLLLVLIVGIYFICAILFESLIQPLIIITTIPLSFIGLFLTFSLFDFYFDQGGYAAFILLGGLVVNASIFIVNDYNNLTEGTEKERILFAIKSKATPVFLTIISTICGLIPFLVGGQAEVFWFSLSVGTIGGLLFSLIAVFIFLPVVMMSNNKQ